MDPKPVENDPRAQQTIRQTRDRRVPDDLIGQLHEANGRADGLRKQLEATLGDADFEQTARAGKVGDELRAVEATIEDLTRRIRDASPPEAKGQA